MAILQVRCPCARGPFLEGTTLGTISPSARIRSFRVLPRRQRLTGRSSAYRRSTEARYSEREGVNEEEQTKERWERKTNEKEEAERRPEEVPAKPPLEAAWKGRGVVITGGSRGLGLALAREFLLCGDRVVVCARGEEQLESALGHLKGLIQEQGQTREMKGAGVDTPGAGGHDTWTEPSVHGMVCDVGNPTDISALGRFARQKLGIIHLWINNAGQVTSRKMLADVPAEDIVNAVSANVVGSILGSREAVRIMRDQPSFSSTTSSSSSNTSSSLPGPPYRIFNLGFSKWGAAFTQSSATHKATKLALAQLNTSLSEELKKAGVSSITVHNLSPGMVLTDLLLKDSTPASRRFFNALAEEPDTVASALVSKINAMDSSTPSGHDVEYLSPLTAIVRVLSRADQIVQGGRFFDKEGRRVQAPGSQYAENGVRVQVPAKG